MKKTAILLIVSILFSAGLLSGCNENASNTEMNKFVGIWKADNDFVITFYSNGTCDPDVLGQKYKIEDGKLIFLKYAYGVELNISYYYSFSSNDTVLTLELIEGDGTSTAFKKQ
jgi:hypothetical protein